MRKKTLLLLFAVLCLFASFAMYVIGNKSVHWEEFKYLFWIPLPISVVLLLAARRIEDN